jgi:lysophospholipase L1-like esterase
MHKQYPASNIRFLRGILIFIALGIGGKLIGIIAKSSLPNLIKNTMLLTFSTIAFVAIIEIIFMFISLSHGSGEAYSGKLWGNRYWNPINKLGLRDEEPKQGKKTIFFVGDSFTAGWGVKQTDQRFGEIVKQTLRKKGKLINEINLGKYGADTRLEYHIFKKFIQSTNIKPDQVVLQFFVNDMDKFIPINKNCIETPKDVPTWKKLIIEGSYLANYINSIYPTNESKIVPEECNYTEKLKYIYSNDSIWEKEELQLDKFKNYCIKNNIRFTIVFFPFMEDLTLAKKIGVENRVITYCKKNKINCLNVTSIINHLSREERQVSITDSHASSEVHRITGEKLASIIKI